MVQRTIEISLVFCDDHCRYDRSACLPAGVTGQAADICSLHIATSSTKLGPERRTPDGRSIRCSTDEAFEVPRELKPGLRHQKWEDDMSGLQLSRRDILRSAAAMAAITA